MNCMRRNSRPWFLLVTSGAVLVLSMSACKTKPKALNAGVLGSRDLVPPPYAQPVAFSTGTAISSNSQPVANPNTTVMPVNLSDREPLPPATEPFVPAENPIYMPVENVPVPENILSTPPSAVKITPAPTEITLPSVAAPATENLRTYAVQKGDTLSGIAQCVGVKWQDIAAMNPKVNPKRMMVGEKLLLPAHAQDKPIVMPKNSKSHKTTTSSKTSQTARIPSDGVYTVSAGDSLWTISRRFKVSSDEIRTWNDLKTDKLMIGQKLKLKGTAIIKETAPKSVATPKATATQTPDNLTTTTAIPNQITDDTLPPQPEQIEDENIITPANEIPAETANTRSLDHLVSESDTLESIAAIYEVKLEDILRSNPNIKSNADLIKNTTIKITYPIKK
ncbi:MAG: LysM peptidoglycan-binding domain-containing protein [Lentisphaeria bacterium]